MSRSLTESPVPPRWLSPANAAAYGDMSINTVRRLIASGDLEATYFTGKTLRVSVKSLDALASKNSTSQYRGGAR